MSRGDSSDTPLSADLSRRANVFPATASRDARLLVIARALRGFADGMVSVLLADYLSALGDPHRSGGA
jgi:hypothetical protein